MNIIPGGNKVKNIFVAFSITIFILVVAVLVFFGYLGAFSKVTVKEEIVGPYKLAYEDHEGSYSLSGQNLDRIYNSLRTEYKLEVTKSFGIYYDNPQKTSAAECRSKLGCIIDEKDYGKIDALKGMYKIMDYKKVKSMTVTFPFKSIVSIYVGMAKAYPAIAVYASDNNYEFTESMEIYDMASKNIVYVMNIRPKKIQ